MRPLKFIISALLLLALFFGACGIACSAGDDGREYRLKAAFLLNFSKFTTWPQEAFTEPDQSFDFCIVGEDPFGTALDGLESKKVGGRSVQVHYSSSIADAKKCHVMFVSQSEEKNLDQLKKAIYGQPVVTVSDIKGFSRKGGTFEFVTKSGRLSFIVNNQQALDNRLQINASLLNLAAEVL